MGGHVTYAVCYYTNLILTTTVAIHMDRKCPSKTILNLNR